MGQIHREADERVKAATDDAWESAATAAKDEAQTARRCKLDPDSTLA